ncbi:MAG: lysylphosphatidylglycerol synthase transmembrane domain-containing protein, partial [Myxococcota bacterium]|nr:lysylphosphatidylglycerol synthase transmembrane domain-containing protein [Myxococcota bacterium]
EAADVWAALGWIALFTIGVFFVDTFTLRLLIVRLLTPMSYRDVLAVKGVSYFLNAITYTAGAGGIAYFVHRKKQVPLLRALSSLVWLNFVDVMALLILLGGGVLFARDRLPDPTLADQVTWLVIGGATVAVGALVYWRLGVDFLVLGAFRTWRIFQCFRDATWKDYGVLLLARTTFIGLYVVMARVLLPTFHIHVDFGGLFVYVPLLTFVQTIPASVSGLGAVQGVMQVLYAPYVDPALAPTAAHADAMVLAFSTVVGPVMSLTRIGMGYFFMNDMTRELIGEMDEALASEDRTDGSEAGVQESERLSSEPEMGSTPTSESDGQTSEGVPSSPVVVAVEEPGQKRGPEPMKIRDALVQPLGRSLIQPLKKGGPGLSSPPPAQSRSRGHRPLRCSPPVRELRRRWDSGEP